MARRNSGLRARLLGTPCIFCGGEEPGTTIEHAPPIAVFEGKQRPKGLEFSACERCNVGTSQLDQVAAMYIGISGDATNGSDSNPETLNYMKGVGNNEGKVLGYIVDGGEEEEVMVDYGGRIESLTRIPVNRRLFTDYLNPWAAKQGCALWFQHTGKIVTNRERISVRWKDPATFMFEGLSDEFVKNFPLVSTMRSGRRTYQDQFVYLFGISDDQSFGTFFLIYRGSVGVLVTITPSEMTKDLWKNFRYGDLFVPNREHGLVACLLHPLNDVHGKIA